MKEIDRKLKEIESQLPIPRKGMETRQKLVIDSLQSVVKSQLPIPRKGMETLSEAQHHHQL